MGCKMRITRYDYLKANRKASREEEIAAHGHSVRIGGIHKSKKVYDRKRDKAGMKKALPYFLLNSHLVVCIDVCGMEYQHLGV